jgi:hypothetical protein
MVVACPPGAARTHGERAARHKEQQAGNDDLFHWDPPLNSDAEGFLPLARKGKIFEACGAGFASKKRGIL